MLAPSTLDVATVDRIDTLPEPAAETVPPPRREVEPQPRWNLATRIAFRFCFLYFSLYVIATQMLGGLLPFDWIRNLGNAPFFQRLVTWTGMRVFALPTAPSFQTTGSGDRMADYLQVFVLLVVAAGVTAVWSLVDRRRPNYRAIDKWFRVFLRFAVGSTMLGYGMVKAIPLQGAFKFDRPHPERLILDGTLDGRAIHMEARLFDPNKFPLLTRGFNWIQERPFNR